MLLKYFGRVYIVVVCLFLLAPDVSFSSGGELPLLVDNRDDAAAKMGLAEEGEEEEAEEEISPETIIKKLTIASRLSAGEYKEMYVDLIERVLGVSGSDEDYMKSPLNYIRTVVDRENEQSQKVIRLTKKVYYQISEEKLCTFGTGQARHYVEDVNQQEEIQDCISDWANKPGSVEEIRREIIEPISQAMEKIEVALEEKLFFDFKDLNEEDLKNIKNSLDLYRFIRAWGFEDAFEVKGEDKLFDIVNGDVSGEIKLHHLLKIVYVSKQENNNIRKVKNYLEAFDHVDPIVHCPYDDDLPPFESLLLSEESTNMLKRCIASWDSADQHMRETVHDHIIMKLRATNSLWKSSYYLTSGSIWVDPESPAESNAVRDIIHALKLVELIIENGHLQNFDFNGDIRKHIVEDRTYSVPIPFWWIPTAVILAVAAFEPDGGGTVVAAGVGLVALLTALVKLNVWLPLVLEKMSYRKKVSGTLGILGVLVIMANFGAIGPLFSGAWTIITTLAPTFKQLVSGILTGIQMAGSGLGTLLGGGDPVTIVGGILILGAFIAWKYLSPDYDKGVLAYVNSSHMPNSEVVDGLKAVRRAMEKKKKKEGCFWTEDELIAGALVSSDETIKKCIEEWDKSDEEVPGQLADKIAEVASFSTSIEVVKRDPNFVEEIKTQLKTLITDHPKTRFTIFSFQRARQALKLLEVLAKDEDRQLLPKYDPKFKLARMVMETTPSEYYHLHYFVNRQDLTNTPDDVKEKIVELRNLLSEYKYWHIEGCRIETPEALFEQARDPKFDRLVIKCLQIWPRSWKNYLFGTYRPKKVRQVILGTIWEVIDRLQAPIPADEIKPEDQQNPPKRPDWDEGNPESEDEGEEEVEEESYRDMTEDEREDFLLKFRVLKMIGILGLGYQYDDAVKVGPFGVWGKGVMFSEMADLESVLMRYYRFLIWENEKLNQKKNLDIIEAIRTTRQAFGLLDLDADDDVDKIIDDVDKIDDQDKKDEPDNPEKSDKDDPNSPDNKDEDKKPKPKPKPGLPDHLKPIE